MAPDGMFPFAASPVSQLKSWSFGRAVVEKLVADFAEAAPDDFAVLAADEAAALAADDLAPLAAADEAVEAALPALAALLLPAVLPDVLPEEAALVDLLAAELALADVLLLLAAELALAEALVDLLLEADALADVALCDEGGTFVFPSNGSTGCGMNNGTTKSAMTAMRAAPPTSAAIKGSFDFLRSG